MKNILLSLIPYLTSKAAVTAAVAVTAGAVVTATATTVVYRQKVAGYEETINRLEASQAGAEAVNGSDNNEADSTAVRVVDGILEVWDGSQWVDYGPIDSVRSADPFYDNDEKREELEKSVAEKKLDELGLKIDEDGKIVPKTQEENGDVPAKKTAPILVGTLTDGSRQNNVSPGANTGKSANDTASKKQTVQTPAQTPATAGLTPEQVMAAIQSGRTIASMPQSTSPGEGVTNVNWTAQPSSGDGGGGSSDSGSNDNNDNNGGDNSSGGGSSSGGGGGGGGETVSSSNESNNDNNNNDDNNVETPTTEQPTGGGGTEGEEFSESVR